MKVSQFAFFLILWVEKKSGTKSQPCGAPVIMPFLCSVKPFTLACVLVQSSENVFLFCLRKHSTSSGMLRRNLLWLHHSPARPWVQVISWHALHPSFAILCMRMCVRACGCLIESVTALPKRKDQYASGATFTLKRNARAHWELVITNGKLHHEGKSRWSDGVSTRMHACARTHTLKATWWLFWLVSSSPSASLALGLDSLNQMGWLDCPGSLCTSGSHTSGPPPRQRLEAGGG